MSENQVARFKPRGRKNSDTTLFKSETTQIGLMAGPVILTAQACAQIQATLGLPDWFPSIIVLTVSLLLSTYCFGVVQKATLGERIVLVPLATVIIFSTALGTNHFVVHSTRGAGQSESIARLEQEVQRLLGDRKRFLDELRKLIGEQPGEEGSKPPDSGRSTPPQTAGSFTPLLGFLVSDAYAQEDPRRPRQENDEERRKREEILRLYEQERQRLQAEEQKLAQQRQNQQRQERRPLWKPW